MLLMPRMELLHQMMGQAFVFGCFLKMPNPPNSLLVAPSSGLLAYPSPYVQAPPMYHPPQPYYQPPQHYAPVQMDARVQVQYPVSNNEQVNAIMVFFSPRAHPETHAAGETRP